MNILVMVYQKLWKKLISKFISNHTANFKDFANF